MKSPANSQKTRHVKVCHITSFFHSGGGFFFVFIFCFALHEEVLQSNSSPHHHPFLHSFLSYTRYPRLMRGFLCTFGITIGGSLGWKVRGALDAAFEKAAYELEPSTVGNPKFVEVKTAHGYHVIMVEGRRWAEWVFWGGGGEGKGEIEKDRFKKNSCSAITHFFFTPSITKLNYPSSCCLQSFLWGGFS